MSGCSSGTLALTWSAGSLSCFWNNSRRISSGLFVFLPPGYIFLVFDYIFVFVCRDRASSSESNIWFVDQPADQLDLTHRSSLGITLAAEPDVGSDRPVSPVQFSSSGNVRTWTVPLAFGAQQWK